MFTILSLGHLEPAAFPLELTNLTSNPYLNCSGPTDQIRGSNLSFLVFTLVNSHQNDRAKDPQGDMLQDGPPVINGVMSLINGLTNG